MAKDKPGTIEVKSFGTHHVITQPNPLRKMLLRVPGFGTKTVTRILAARRNGPVRYGDLLRMGAIMSKAKPFVTLPDWHPGVLTDSAGLRARFAPPPEQLQLL